MTAWWLIVATIIGTPGGEAGSGVEVSALITGLTAPRRADRERAERRLEAIGDAARPALLRAIESRDLELKARAAVVLDVIEGRDLSVPKLIRLDFRDAKVTEVVDAIADRTGQGLILQPGNDLKRGELKITLVADEEVSFWEAVDRLEKGAGLQVAMNPNMGWNNRMAMGGFNGVAPRVRRPVTGQEVVLVPSAGTPRAPESRSGRFDVSVMNIHHQRDRTLGTLQGHKTPDTTVDRFEVRLRIMPEPSLLIGAIGQVEGLEAVDDRGRSLVPESRGVLTNQNQARAMQNVMYQGGLQGPASIVLEYPEQAGSTIRTLKGAFKVTVVGTRPDGVGTSLILGPGVPARKGGASITVHSVKDAAVGQMMPAARMIELTLNRPDVAGRPNNGMAAYERTVNVVPSVAQGALHFLDAKGRLVDQIALTPYNVVDGQRRTLQFRQPQGSDPAVEVRYLAPAWAELSVPFEFHDLPMP